VYTLYLPRGRLQVWRIFLFHFDGFSQLCASSWWWRINNYMWRHRQSKQSARLPLQSSKLAPPTPSPVRECRPPLGYTLAMDGLGVNYCDIFMQYYATHTLWNNILNVPTGKAFCRIFLHQLVNAPVKVVKTLPNVLCSSRDGVPLGPKKNTFRQTSLSKWIDW